jgi:hypothetical protein
MIDFLVRFDKVKAKPSRGSRYVYSEKHPQRGYPLNPYNYKNLDFSKAITPSESLPKEAVAV